jgi:ribosome-binding ATPase YchF (GTP1/OBG family)
LGSIFQPKKFTPAKIDLSLSKTLGEPEEVLKNALENARLADVLILVLRNFVDLKGASPDPAKEALDMESRLIVADFLTVSKRLEKLAEEKKKGKKTDPEEQALLEEALTYLDNSKALRELPKISKAPKLRGFGLLSAKTCLALINNPDDSDNHPPLPIKALPLAMRARLEDELSRLSAHEAAEFAADYGLKELGRDKVIRAVYQAMDLISFFTVGEDECRAWTLERSQEAYAAAGVIHSDIQKGFIRAEVVAFSDFKDCGGFNEAKKRGLFRLEGKNYQVKDGDIAHFRFNV